MFSETDARVSTENTSEAAHEQAPTYETVPTISDNNNIINPHNYMNNELSDAIYPVAHPQLLVIAKSDKSTQEQEKPHLQLATTNLSSTIHLEQNIRSSDLQVDERGHYDQICQYETISHYEKVPHCDLALIASTQRILPVIHDECYYNEENSQDAKPPCSDAKQIEAASDSEDIEQNTHSHNLQVDKRGHRDQNCQYESISHYEKVPHCDLALISSAQRKPVHDEKLPPPTCFLTETGKK